VESPLAEVVEGYAKLASMLVERWSDQASKVASKLDEGTYDADSAAADLARAATLATESAVLLANEGLNAAAVLAGRRGQPYVIESRPFAIPRPGARLDLAEPLRNLNRSDELPTSSVSFKPSGTLGPKESEFRLSVQAAGRRGGTYTGEVTASDPQGVAPVRVWITIP
jgi:hypothetical protein